MVEQIPGFEALRLKYIDQLVERRRIICDAIASLDGAQDALQLENLTNAHVLLHQICGSAGSFGYTDLGDAARLCDERITAHRNSGKALTQADIAALQNDVAAFGAQCQIVIDAAR